MIYHLYQSWTTLTRNQNAIAKSKMYLAVSKIFCEVKPFNTSHSMDNSLIITPYMTAPRRVFTIQQQGKIHNAILIFYTMAAMAYLFVCGYYHTWVIVYGLRRCYCNFGIISACWDNIWLLRVIMGGVVRGARMSRFWEYVGCCTWFKMTLQFYCILDTVRMFCNFCYLYVKLKKIKLQDIRSTAWFCFSGVSGYAWS